ncbi:capsule assembly Wzi family protein [Spirosoma sp. KCTC 42546]|uniref:capsule assembly Wzi family protein n=1 Tax=Spirosoma sp. KCTC 42546 TaxID=2520506 RepID=UPI0011596220|nr:capsule assembly Wzi family protein [Spirosoma sp. KCTC 42546]QDK81597.1 capsule assembly Wzi family protein [Spirosoma sp. KCTC 42546]
MTNVKLCIPFASSLLAVYSALAQPTHPVQYQTEVGFYGTSIPFWLRANQYGIVPSQGPSVTLRQGFSRAYRSVTRNNDSLPAHKRRIDWGWGVEGVLNAGASYKLLLPVAYVKVKFGKNLEVWAGRRREIIGLVDSTLSSGSYAWSGNALPMTKLQIGLPDYVPGNALFGIKGFYAHGWFENDRLVNHVLLHQKALYGRLGKPNWRFKLYTGMNHEVMWSGTTNQLAGKSVIKNDQLPNQFSDYINVVLARPLGDRTDLDTSRISTFDHENRIGNHLGTVDLALEYTARSFSVFAYRQNIYEDGSLFHLTNLADGLNGLRIRNRRPRNPNGLQIQDVLLEYVYTQSQGGSLFLENDAQRGRDNYFNHSQYQDGWSRYGLTLGTPFISPTTDSRAELPRYGFTNNNRVAVMHLGLSGLIMDYFRFYLKASYSENIGTYEVPFLNPVYQFSGLLSISSPVRHLKGTTATASLATDQGELYENRMGFYVGFRKEGLF